MTQKKTNNIDSTNFKSNIVENILRARCSKYISEPELKEHMVMYLASGKSMHSSQIFSKQGAKGTRPMVEKILKISEKFFTFSPPKKSICQAQPKHQLEAPFGLRWLYSQFLQPPTHPGKYGTSWKISKDKLDQTNQV